MSRRYLSWRSSLFSFCMSMELPVLIMDKLLSNPPVAVEQLKMLRLDNSTNENAAERLIGRPLLDFRDGIDYINQPLQEQKRHVRALAAPARAHLLLPAPQPAPHEPAQTGDQTETGSTRGRGDQRRRLEGG